MKTELTRRHALKITAFALTASIIVPNGSAQSEVGGPPPPFRVPPLPYAVDSLEPHIDARTLETHHNQHHSAFVANLNQVAPRIVGPPDWSFETLIKNLGSVPEMYRASIRQNGGGHYNHSLFWQMMKKDGGGEPKGELADALVKQFGGFSGFRNQLTTAALGIFGSGWTWLTIEAGRLKVETTPNEDAPLSAGRNVLLGVDVWEHAYYRKYQNRRADYVTAWWNVVDWDFVTERYLKLRS